MACGNSCRFPGAVRDRRERTCIRGLQCGEAGREVITKDSISGSGSSDKLRRLNLRDILVTVQVALSVVLLIGSILVVRSLQHAFSLNLGFQPEHGAVLSLDLAGQGYDEEHGREFQRRLLDKVRGMPGIQVAAMSSGLPLALNTSKDAIYLEGRPEPRPGDVPKR